MNKKINFIGWQNHDNLGDEAIYYVDQKLFPKYNLVSSNDRLISNITLFGGGTLLPHWPYICPINKYNYAFGVGVQDIRFIKNYKNCYIDLTKKSNFPQYRSLLSIHFSPPQPFGIHGSSPAFVLIIF